MLIKLTLDVDQITSDFQLPGHKDRLVLAVGSNTVHGETADIVEVGHVLLVLLSNGGQALLFDQALVTQVELAGF